MNNQFTVSFGQQPINFIERNKLKSVIVDDFSLDFPSSKIYIISGVRGSGKTVLLTDIANTFKMNDDFIVIDVNPNRDILEQIAAGIYENSSVKHLFISKSFSISFHGLGFSIEGKEPISNIKTVLEKMLNVIEKKNKKVLITIDEANNGINMRSFVHDFQSLQRDNHQVFLLMTGLYENVNSLQNNKNLTFLYRAPKIDLGPLDLSDIKNTYRKVFEGISDEVIMKLTNLTKGYAFAFQVIGYLFSKNPNINELINELDKYLKIYVYDKIWSGLPQKESQLLKLIKDEEIASKEIINSGLFSKKEFSVYRDRLIKRGLINGDKYGIISLTLPRFNEFIKTII